MNSDTTLPFVLLISDNTSEVSFFKKSLKQSYQLFHAKTEIDAFELLRSLEITAFIIDEKFSETDAFELIKSIRSMPSYKITPILLITSTLKKKYIEEALNRGCTDFLNTPLDADETHQRLSVALGPLRTKEKMAAFQPKRMPTPSKKPRKFTRGPTGK